jgi:uncharacterized phage-associated protein
MTAAPACGLRRQRGRGSEARSRETVVVTPLIDSFIILPYYVVMNEPMLRFQFDEKKGVEALTYIASKWPSVTQFYASKVLFFAEKYHLNRYARPIVADTFIAMPNGPVPSTLYDFIKGNLDQAGDPDAITQALEISGEQYSRIKARRKADSDALSPSDIECLNEAIALCLSYSKKPGGFRALSSLTHQERAYLKAPTNGPMNYADLIEDNNPEREAVLEDAREFAAYGVL